MITATKGFPIKLKTIAGSKIFPFIFLLTTGCSKKNPPEGAYLLTSTYYIDSTASVEDIAKHKTVKVFKDGYWIAASYSGSKQTTVESAAGGTYAIKDDNYIETINFTSTGDAEFGKSYSYAYKYDGGIFIQEGKRSNGNCQTCQVKEKYSRIKTEKSVRDTLLEGVWKLVDSEWFGKKVEDPDYMMVKIYSYPCFAWGAYHLKGKDFIGVGGGTYEFDGKKLVEHLEYFSYYDIVPGNELIDVVKLPSGAISLINIGSAGKEIYERVRQ